jgi:Ni/Co efflux regulator RcnB
LNEYFREISMKTLLLTAAAAALVLAAPAAFAADDHHGGGHPGGGHAMHTTHAAPTHMAAPAHTAHVAKPSRTMSMSRTRTTRTTTRTRSHRGIVKTTAAPGPIGGRNVRGRGNHTSGGGTHVTINFNRHNVSASHHFHYRGGAYNGPSGYSYHRYSYGETLPSIYFAQNYWISDYDDYGLVSPPDGAVWVRYGDDAILLDQDSGEILEVVYGQFY